MAVTEEVPASRWAAFKRRAAKPPLRQLLQLLAVLIVSYFGLIALLMIREESLLFQPRRESDGWLKAPEGLIAEDVWMTTPGGTRIHGWWCPLEGASGALLYAHGAGGNLTYSAKDALRLQQALNLSVLLYDYEGYGKSDGSPSEAGCYAAADAAYSWLLQKVPAERLVIFGESLGGAVAIDLAVRQPHKALVTCKAFSSMPDMAQKSFPFLPVWYLVRNRFESIDKIGRGTRPVFIAHGDRDGLIPIEQGRRLFEAAPEPKKFFVMTDCDHGNACPVEFYVKLDEFLRSIK